MTNGSSCPIDDLLGQVRRHVAQVDRRDAVVGEDPEGVAQAQVDRRRLHHRRSHGSTTSRPSSTRRRSVPSEIAEWTSTRGSLPRLAACRAAAQAEHGGAAVRSPRGPRAGAAAGWDAAAARTRDGLLRRGLLVLRTAHHTMPNSMKIGIFRTNISQMKPQVILVRQTTPRSGRASCVQRSDGRVERAHLAEASRGRRPRPRERLQALGAEGLDVEGGQRGAVGQRRAEVRRRRGPRRSRRSRRRRCRRRRSGPPRRASGRPGSAKIVVAGEQREPYSPCLAITMRGPIRQHLARGAHQVRLVGELLASRRR